MLSPQSLPWIEPLELASGIDEPYWVLLYSGAKTNYSGRYSYLAHRLAERVEADDFGALEKKLGAGGAAFDNAWFGYLGYGLKDSLERLAPDRPAWPHLPALCMMRFHSIYQFDHEARKMTLWSDRPHAPLAPKAFGELPPVAEMHSNMSREEYLKKAAEVIERIHAGDLYQANLTRKFRGRFAGAPEPFALFKKLCAASPAPYSAYIRVGGISILSSSPELFLRIGAGGEVTARPIKGTAPRFGDAALDNASREALAASEKDRAENLMIVDLMRNDLARSCEPGSVAARDMFEVSTHATIHHMVSTVVGRKRAEVSTLELVKHCFPPGSMTGAPKIKAMNLCSALEGDARGVYSGAIGWFGSDGSGELSVVIRTLIIGDADFEFQVGGGIVADSTPEKELKEIIDKSRGMLAALGVGPDFIV